MPKKMFRCYACTNDNGLPGRDFVAENPVCPACGLDGTTNPRFKPLFAELAVVHFDPPTAVPGVGTNRPACDPKKKIGGPGVDRATGEPLAVTCPACKGSKTWQDAMEARGEPITPPEADLEVTIDPKAMTFTTPAGG